MSGKDGQGIHRVVVAQCTASKRDGTHPARELYEPSTYFRKQRDYAEAVADKWFIQSAEYGLLCPDERVESYDTHAKNIEDSGEWAALIARDLAALVPQTATVEILGGAHYADPLTPELEARGFDVLEPLRGQGIGTRMASLGEMANTSLEGFA